MIIELFLWRMLVLYTSGSQTVRRDAPVRGFNFPRASLDNLDFIASKELGS